MAGVKIGAVEKTRLAGRMAQAVLLVEPGIRVANDSTASIVMAGLLGTDYVGIDLGSDNAPALENGELISLGPPSELRHPSDPRVADFLNPIIDIQHPRFKKLETS